jgi:hypothetical protein
MMVMKKALPKTAAVAGVLLPHMRRRVMTSVEPHLPIGEPNMARAPYHRGHNIGPSQVTINATRIVRGVPTQAKSAN